jgi:hypothetical protein
MASTNPPPPPARGHLPLQQVRYVLLLLLRTHASYDLIFFALSDPSGAVAPAGSAPNTGAAAASQKVSFGKYVPSMARVNCFVMSADELLLSDVYQPSMLRTTPLVVNVSRYVVLCSASAYGWLLHVLSWGRTRAL